jgi:hypothetical protein
MRCKMLTAGLLTLGLALAARAQDAPRPTVEFVVAAGEASAVPSKQGVSWANGGIIEITQPNPATLVITMTGLTATNANLACTSIASYQFNLMQEFAIRFNNPRVKEAKLIMEGRVIGLLRTNHEPYTKYHCQFGCGSATTQAATAAVTSEAGEVVSLQMPARATAGCADLSVYNHEGPICAQVHGGCFVLHETWGFGTTHPGFFSRGASAEFAPQPNYYPPPGNFWFQHFQPFNGTATKDFGFQVTLKLIPELPEVVRKPEPTEKPAPEKKPKEDKE